MVYHYSEIGGFDEWAIGYSFSTILKLIYEKMYEKGNKNDECFVDALTSLFEACSTTSKESFGYHVNASVLLAKVVDKESYKNIKEEAFSYFTDKEAFVSRALFDILCSKNNIDVKIENNTPYVYNRQDIFIINVLKLIIIYCKGEHDKIYKLTLSLLKNTNKLKEKEEFEILDDTVRR